MAAMCFNQFLHKIDRLPPMSNINVQSLKTIGQSNLELECTQHLKMGGGHCGNKMADFKFFLTVLPLDPEMNTENLKMKS